MMGCWSVGPILGCQEISSGLMHSTFMVQADSPYTLQRLHPKLSTHEIIGDYEAVTEHLAARGALTPRLIPTREDTRVAVDPAGRWWRLASFVPGHTLDRVDAAWQAEQGARALGRFHRLIADIEHCFASQHPLHDTAGHLARLKAALDSPAHAAALELVEAEVAQILERLPQAMLPALPERVVHGDPKISNVLFREREAVGLIDLDTCNAHTLLVDLGDAVRSWCRDGREDERQGFQIERFEAMLRGYAAEGPSLSPEERESLVDAGRCITLELASRFARDVLEDDYFAFDANRYPDRRSHNLARTRGMLHLAADMAAQRGAVQALIRTHLG